MIDNDPLYVVTTIFNPKRYKSRYDLYKKFEKHVIDSGAKLMTVEVAFGDRPHTVTEEGNPNHLQLRTKHEIWLKENALNLGVQRLPNDWKYVAIVDADIQFCRPDWVNETKHQLQHNPVVQMWSHANDLAPDFTPHQTFKSFAYCYRNGIPRAKSLAEARYYDYAEYWHPGFTWGYTREAWNNLGGLIDFAILGSADFHMAMCMIGQGSLSMPKNINQGYKESVSIWEQRASQYIMGHIGYVPGSINHFWHGAKRNRFYRERWKILIENKYDPEFDLKKDSYGLWQLTDRSPQLRRMASDYFQSRNEDSIDL